MLGQMLDSKSYQYLRYILIVLWTPLRKLIGLVWYWILPVWCRGWSRNYHYNYVLQNGIYLHRLLERPRKEIRSYSSAMLGWDILPYHSSEGGYIRYRKVNRLIYLLNYWFIWGWLDDDSNYDTYDRGYNETIINGERLTWLPEYIRRVLQRHNSMDCLYGNSFDLGDKRSDFPCLPALSAFLWTLRNTAYNFKYMQWKSNKQHFYHKVGKFEFGWKPDPHSNGAFELVFGVW